MWHCFLVRIVAYAWNEVCVFLSKSQEVFEILIYIPSHGKIKVNFILGQATKPRGCVEVYLYSFFNFGARWGWVVNATPRPLITLCVGGWTGAEIFASTGIRSLDRPSRRESVYRLKYPDHTHTHKHTQYLLLFHDKNNSRTRLNVTLYVHCLPCLILEADTKRSKEHPLPSSRPTRKKKAEYW